MTGLSSAPFSLPPTLKSSHCCYHSRLNVIPSNSSNPRLFSNPNLRTPNRFMRTNGIQCSSSGGGGPGPRSDENDSRVVLDAFFLGKAFAEALNERIGSAVGEILSVVGQWQAEQQRQVQDFQEEVLERAKKAQKKAALEALEDEGIISESSTSRPDSTSRDSTTPLVPPTSRPMSDDPFQAMLKD